MQLRRALIWCAGGLVVAALTCAAPSAQADGVRIPPVITASSTVSTTVQVHVPRGVVVTGVAGLLTVTRSQDDPADDPAGTRGTGSTVVSVGGRVVGAYPDVATRYVRVGLRPQDVTQGVIALSLRHRQTEEPRCGYQAPQVSVELSRLVLQYSGHESLPQRVGAFFGPEVTGVDVVLPDEPTDDAVEAALTAVAALSEAYPAPVPVHLLRGGDAPSRTAAGQRVVRIEAGPADAALAITRPTAGVATLVVAGEDADLVAAARSLGSSTLGLAALPDATSVSLGESADPVVGGADADTTMPMSAFTASDVLTLGGWGTSSTYVGIAQDEFGGPVEQLDLHLVGAHTAITGYDARLDAFVNDELVSSQMLGEDPALDLHLTVPAGLVHPENGVELVLSALPRCDEGGHSHLDIAPRLDVDTAGSTVVAVRGDGDSSGFELFPQVLGHRLPVAVRDTSSSAPDGDEVRRAAALVTALQRSATTLLTVDLLPPEALLDSTESGLLVGATDADTAGLHAPLRLERVRLIDFEEATFQLGDDAQYAALQVVPEGDRELLVLGAWTPDQPGLESTLGDVLVDRVVDSGWRSLENDLLIVTPTHEPFDLSTRNLLPQTSRIEESRSAATWVLGGVGLLVMVILAQLVVSARRRRAIARLVTAQSSEEQASAQPAGSGRTGDPRAGP
ncbi:hypothetical protein BH11ACT8_BH11ACT8_03600 [soil metagenome]